MLVVYLYNSRVEEPWQIGIELPGWGSGLAIEIETIVASRNVEGDAVLSLRVCKTTGWGCDPFEIVI